MIQLFWREISKEKLLFSLMVLKGLKTGVLLIQLQNILQKIRFAHLAKGVTLQGQFRNFRFAQHLQNYFKCSLRSLFTNKFMYARDARAQIRPLPRFFRLPNFVLLRAFTAGWMPLYLFHNDFHRFVSYIVRTKKFIKK